MTWIMKDNQHSYLNDMNAEQLIKEGSRAIAEEGWYKSFGLLYSIHQRMKELELAERELVYQKVG